MMLQNLIFALALAVLYIQQVHSANLKLYPKNVQDEIIKCRTTYKVTETMIDSFTVPKESICFFNCTAVALEYMSPAGNVTFSNYKKLYGSVIPKVYVTSLGKCAPKAVGKDACEVAYNWRKCLADLANEE